MASQNALFETQIKNFLIHRKIMFLSRDFQFFYILVIHEI